MTLPKRPFTHRVYVDFSGDDGDPAKPGASKTLVMAWVISAEQDIRHNEGVILELKKLIGSNPKSEIKYKTLRRHKKARQAFALLSKIRIQAIVLPVVKGRVSETDIRNPGTKKLVQLLHQLPFEAFYNHVIETNTPEQMAAISLQFVFDEIGWQGCQDAIITQMRADDRIIWENSPPNAMFFGRSNANLMLQLADIVAGLAHDYIDDVIGKRLPPCFSCVHKHHRDCSFRRTGQPLGKHHLMKTLRPLLLKDARGNVYNRGFMPRPPNVDRERMFWFVDCLFG